mmetsp:Transcript_9862/g.40098  ORF Transcript_9862/g.40098 Transcript_9862/m.40098 type:complete len:271 (+) Transcript_9862:399-1211(+)
MSQEVGLAAERPERVGDGGARERVAVDEAAGEEDALPAPQLGGVGAREHAARLRDHLEERAAHVGVGIGRLGRAAARPRRTRTRRRPRDVVVAAARPAVPAVGRRPATRRSARGPAGAATQLAEGRRRERGRQAEVGAARVAVDVLDERVDVGGVAARGEVDGLVERRRRRQGAREAEEGRAADGGAADARVALARDEEAAHARADVDEEQRQERLGPRGGDLDGSLRRRRQRQVRDGGHRLVVAVGGGVVGLDVGDLVDLVLDAELVQQ